MNTDETSSTSLWAIGAGALAVLSGVAVLGFIGMRFIADAGWNGSGSGFRNQWQGLAPVLAALLAAGLGVAALLTRRAGLGTSPGRQVFVGVTALAALLAPLALLAYPRFSDAVLTGETWHTRLPVTQVLGMRSLTGDRLVIEGVEDHHECQFTLRALTLDLRTGRLLDVKDLPSTYPDISHVPPAPTPLDPARFTVDQGSSPFVCSS